jgi:hypothetical protein
MFTRYLVNIEKNYLRNRQWRPVGLWDVEDPTLSTEWRHTKSCLGFSHHFCSFLGSVYVPQLVFWIPENLYEVKNR